MRAPVRQRHLPILLLLMLIAGAVALAGPARAADADDESFSPRLCATFPPEPVCDQIVGLPPHAVYTFSISSPVDPPREACAQLEFAVSGRPVKGTLNCRQVEASVFGNFEPAQPLLVGNEVCMTVPWLKPSRFCETVPSPSPS